MLAMPYGGSRRLLPTAQWVTEHAAAFEALNAALGVSSDDFIRTSASPAHAPAVRTLWEACAARGDLYQRPYRGLYCVGCERFYEPEELASGRCPEHDAPLEVVEETNWFFRLSRYRDTVREAIEFAADQDLRRSALGLAAEVDEAVGRLALDEALTATFRLVDATNRYVTLAAPWDLVRHGQTERAAVVLRTSLEALHVIARELAPFLPATSDELRTRLQAPALGGETQWNVLPTGARLRRGGPLFRRIGAEDSPSERS